MLEQLLFFYSVSRFCFKYLSFDIVLFHMFNKWIFCICLGHPGMGPMQRMSHPGGRMPGPMNPVSCSTLVHLEIVRVLFHTILLCIF